MALITPYITNAEADILLTGNTVWEATSETDQDRALELGRLYIDSRYTCIYFDEDDPPEAIKVANAELAVEYLTNPTTFLGNSTDIGLTRKRVKAGPVESEKEFESTEVESKDLYPNISLILSEYCTRSAATRFITR